MANVEPYALLFPKDKWDKKAARAWAKEHGYKVRKVVSSLELEDIKDITLEEVEKLEEEKEYIHVVVKPKRYKKFRTGTWKTRRGNVRVLWGIKEGESIMSVAERLAKIKEKLAATEKPEEKPEDEAKEAEKTDECKSPLKEVNERIDSLEEKILEAKQKAAQQLSQADIAKGKLSRALKVPKDKDIPDVYTAEEIISKYKNAKSGSSVRKMIQWAANMAASRSKFWAKVKKGYMAVVDKEQKK